jgi:hypothetical protein
MTESRMIECCREHTTRGRNGPRVSRIGAHVHPKGQMNPAAMGN